MKRPAKLPRRIQVERDLGRRGSLWWFVKRAWPVIHPGTPLGGEKMVRLICAHLEAVTAGKLKRLKIHVPPGHSKTLLVQVFWPVWEWLRFPHLRVNAVSYDGELTRLAAAKAKKLIESDWFRERWGDVVSIPRGAGDGTYETHQGGIRRSSSVGGALTGHHMERLIVDDPTNPKFLTDVALASVQKWWSGVVVGRLNIHLAVVVIMQRVHEDDLSGFLNDPEWVTLSLPAFFEPEHRCVTPFGEDWRQEEGEVLAPDIQDDGILREKERGMGPVTASAQLQQRPAPAGGLIIKKEYRRVYSSLPEEAFTPAAIWIQSWDLAVKDKRTSDPVAGQTWVAIGARYFLVDRFHRRMGFGESKEAIRTFRAKWPLVRAVLIEDKANGPPVIEELQKEIPGIIAVDPKGGKEPRLMLVEPLHRAGQVWVPDPDDNPWVEATLHEWETFPVGRHDDEVDAMSQALAYFLSKASGYSQARARLPGAR